LLVQLVGYTNTANPWGPGRVVFTPAQRSIRN